MSDPVNQAQFYEAFQQLQDKIDSKHTSMREFVGQRADKIEAILHAHAVEDAQQFKLVSDRVLIIETERTQEAKQSVRRGTWAGILAAAGLTGVLRAVEHWWK